MTRLSGTALIAATVLFALVGTALAQNGVASSPPGTNNAGTAQSSGPASNRKGGVTTGSAGLGSGHAAADPTSSPNAAINAENDLIDRKLKGICRGC